MSVQMSVWSARPALNAVQLAVKLKSFVRVWDLTEIGMSKSSNTGVILRVALMIRSVLFLVKMEIATVVVLIKIITGRILALVFVQRPQGVSV